jgi:hypothetical protein
VSRFKITLDDVKPTVPRRIEVPLTLRRDCLHLAIQAAMGWTNSHLHEIRAGDVGWGTNPDWSDGPLHERKARLIRCPRRCRYKDAEIHYDFGGGWKHTIKVERHLDPQQGLIYPRLIEATGRCPPEDIAAPEATPNSSMRSTPPNPNATSNSPSGSLATSIRNSPIPRGLAEQVAALAKCWSRTPTTPRPLHA